MTGLELIRRVEAAGGVLELRPDNQVRVLLPFEVRDEWTHASPAQHNIVFRVMWLAEYQISNIRGNEGTTRRGDE